MTDRAGDDWAGSNWAGSNWAGNHRYRAARLLRPRDVGEVQRIVRRGRPVRALGSRHSFSDLADTTGDLVSVTGLEGGIAVERDTRTVSVPAGATYGELASALHPAGWAVANLASLPHISVAGAVATGTHGSGDRNGGLGTAVAGLEFVDGRGELVRLDRSHPDLAGAVVSLGALGIVTRLVLDVEPTYQVRQDVYEGLRWSDLLDHLDELLADGYSVSVFTRWTGAEVGLLWRKDRLGEDGTGSAPCEVYGARRCGSERHVIDGMPPTHATAQLGVPGPWHERLPHFRMGFTPSRGEELQSEYLVPRDRAGEALRAMRDLGPDLAPLLFVSELRTVAADDLWLSGAYGVPVLAIHLTWRRQPRLVLPLLGRIEERLLPLGARPHWGKVFLAGRAALAPRLPRLDDFLALARRYDPDGLFGNDWLARTIGLTGPVTAR